MLAVDSSTTQSRAVRPGGRGPPPGGRRRRQSPPHNFCAKRGFLWSEPPVVLCLVMGNQRDPCVTRHPPSAPNAEAWERIQASDLGDRMKRALTRVAAGASFREAAHAECYADHA